MKRTHITAAALLTSLVPAASVMAHSEAVGQTGVIDVAHKIAHALPTTTWLPATLLLVVLAAIFIARINKRES